MRLALETLDQLLHQGERGIGILLAAVVPTVRNLLLVKDLLLSHKLASSFAAAILCRNPQAPFSGRAPPIFREKKMAPSAPIFLESPPPTLRIIRSSELKEGFAACAAANQQLLSGSLTDEVILERLLIDLLSRKDRQTD